MFFSTPGAMCLQVLVLRLQTLASIEEKVYAAAAQKRTVADASITGMQIHST